jgi:integrase
MAQIVKLAVVASANEKFTVRRKPNAEFRSREHLTEREVDRLVEAVKGNRQGHRDATMVLLAFRHGLRVAELVDLRWEQADLENALLHVRRLKNGSPATHPLTGRELRALRRLQREQEPKSPFVFISERGAPFSKRGFQAMVERAGEVAGFDMKIHPHMLRQPAASNWQTRASTPARSRHISGTSQSNTRCAIPSSRQLGSRAFSGIDVASS